MGTKRIIRPLPTPLGYKKPTIPFIGNGSQGKLTSFQETDGVNLPGIDPQTNNYPPNRYPISYYSPDNYYYTENESTYYEIIYQF